MTWMEKETREAPRSIEKQLKENAPLLREFAKWLKKSPPPLCGYGRKRKLWPGGAVSQIPFRNSWGNHHDDCGPLRFHSLQG